MLVLDKFIGSGRVVGDMGETSFATVEGSNGSILSTFPYKLQWTCII